MDTLKFKYSKVHSRKMSYYAKEIKMFFPNVLCISENTMAKNTGNEVLRNILTCYT